MIGKVPFFKTKWEDGRHSVNDLLRRFLAEHKYEYINTFDGVVWFLSMGKWRCCTYDVQGGDIQFYLCEFIDN